MLKALLAVCAVMLLMACAQNREVRPEFMNNADEYFSVLPNKALYLSLQLDQKVISDIETTASESQSNLSFSRSAMDDSGVMMSVRNETTRILKFDLYMVGFQGNRHYTSSCPVMAEGGVFEMWPHPIPEILVTNIRVLPAGSAMVCQ